MNDSEKLTLGWFLAGLLALATGGLVSGGLWIVLAAAGDQTGADAARIAALVSGGLLVVVALAQLVWISVRLIRAPERRAT